MDVSRLEEASEITMRTVRRDGSWSSRPIWVVVVDEQPYVRSANGERGVWYRKVLSGAEAEIVADGQTAPITAEPVRDQAMNELVSQAYRDKYAASSPGSTDALNSGESRVTTLRLNVPARSS